MRANSLALRLFLSATATTVIILAVTSFILSSLYRQAIERAFRLDLHSDVAYHYKAMLLKREGRLAEARAHFRRALHLNPRNVDARRELRVLLMRKRDNNNKPSGLLERIFRRTPPPTTAK